MAARGRTRPLCPATHVTFTEFYVTFNTNKKYKQPMGRNAQGAQIERVIVGGTSGEAYFWVENNYLRGTSEG